MFVAEDEKVFEPISPQQQPRDWRAELREELLRTISSTNVQVMGKLLANAGGSILMPGAEEQDYVLKLEEYIYQEVLNAPGSEDEKMARYISLGNEYLEKLKDHDVFSSTVDQYRSMRG
jgi:hypothetical protein